MDPRQHLSSLKRGLAVLAELNRAGSLTLAEVAVLTGVPRTTAQRIVETLVAEGYVERVADSRVYRPTPSVNLLSAGFTDDSWVCHVASARLFGKTAEIGWPLAITTQCGEHMVVRVSTDRATTLALGHFRVGYATPVMDSASGHVLLACSSPADREAILKIVRRSRDPRQALVHDPAAVRRIVEQVSAAGFAHIVYPDRREAYIAAPLLLAGRTVACAHVHYMRSAYRPDEAERLLVPMLLDLTRAVEADTVAMKADIAAAGSRRALRPANRTSARGTADAARSSQRHARCRPETSPA